MTHCRKSLPLIERTLDNAGNRTAKTNYLDNSSEQYAYDAIYELTQVTRNGQTSESYTSDSVGNHLSSLNLSPWSFDDSNHLLSTPSTTFTYDNIGNTLTKECRVRVPRPILVLA